MGRSYTGLHRMSFVIDRDGKLRHVFEKVNTKTHHDDVLNWISANLE
jgi:peroxiredoxin Q/BCP